MTWACDALCRKEGDGNGSTLKRGKPERRWLDRVRGDIKEKGLSGRKCMTVVYRQTLNPHKSGINKIKRK